MESYCMATIAQPAGTPQGIERSLHGEAQSSQQIPYDLSQANHTTDANGCDRDLEAGLRTFQQPSAISDTEGLRPGRRDLDPFVVSSLHEKDSTYRLTRVFHGAAALCIQYMSERISDLEQRIRNYKESDGERLDDLKLRLEDVTLKQTRFVLDRYKIHQLEPPHSKILRKMSNYIKNRLPEGSGDYIDPEAKDWMSIPQASGLERWLRMVPESDFGKFLCVGLSTPETASVQKWRIFPSSTYTASQLPFKERNQTDQSVTAQFYSDKAFKIIRWVIFNCTATAFACVPVVIQALASHNSRKVDVICYVVFLFVLGAILSLMFRDMSTVALMIMAYGALLANNLKRD